MKMQELITLKDSKIANQKRMELQEQTTKVI